LIGYSSFCLKWARVSETLTDFRNQWSFRYSLRVSMFTRFRDSWSLVVLGFDFYWYVFVISIIPTTSSVLDPFLENLSIYRLRLDWKTINLVELVWYVQYERFSLSRSFCVCISTFRSCNSSKTVFYHFSMWNAILKRNKKT
jgi:hypothetical protein